MTYEEMLNVVCAGKTAYRPTVPDMIVFREGDTIIRRSHRKVEINQVFIASVEEQKATDWDIVAEQDHHDGLHCLHFIEMEAYGVRFHINQWCGDA
ncbi:hypothetical protein Lw1_gp269 [Escherichia phage Lw1]|uniref:Uncharacterized protein n=2 Tax=Pseudotevenvirus TaxID=2842979 RepID=M9V1N5_9CAUD|nr:hypothetical protein RB16p263 [Escherichia phage RB16]YP_008060789.1 hypothetical protein Lw1_gp269 [Escherichia phage Lw1]ADJ55567.1 conserved hypothetical phage protein [Escherichia phage RB16]AGJ71674.1 hypothetical protein Lw1_gp269 [Escherichia phage Lw1]